MQARKILYNCTDHKQAENTSAIFGLFENNTSKSYCTVQVAGEWSTDFVVSQKTDDRRQNAKHTKKGTFLVSKCKFCLCNLNQT